MESLVLETISRHVEDQDVIKSSQHGITVEKLCLTKLINFYDELTGLSSLPAAQNWEE